MSVNMNKRKAAGLVAIGAGAIGATVAVKKRRSGSSSYPWKRG
jgi:hypothetical protein